ncbi:putative C2H2 transcription factor [Aspergillus flavus]|uniref:C2H2 transcription factor n=1 Tax=Aspergillus flavus (strain ATCC 200026 / FGSC A1120 / IAM 13836 / NRRL 3357 / JCM 12722 / SRRC 167) TaxID=332952 RepID=A0A7U2R329_ASPFN|nr:hypothetical protein AFLA_008906 [Aspergillus flavus NRRL3357]QRD93944.1 putative C2H2 transcription factor [Aspergillus flavus]RAQ71711.1 C2H2 transcription factor [Aspergillus flavus]RAQ80308.1 C2H2 transcription factor [Aspergillus flavus]
MASHTKKDDYCLECHWESFHIDGKESENQSNAPATSQWDCSGEGHDASLDHCHVDDACCDMDDCSITCPSVCDGLVDCEETACTDTHCNDGCDDTHCENAETLCFDEHCFGNNGNDTAVADHTLESLLGLAGPINLESNDLLSACTVGQSQGDQLPKPTGNITSDMVAPQPSMDSLFPQHSIPVAHCHSHSFPHFHFHDSSKDAHGNMMHQPFPAQNGVNPADVFHMLGMCPDLSACQNFHVHENTNCDHVDKPNTDASSNSFACFHIPPNVNLNDLMKSPVHIHSNPSRGPCRTHHRCRTHAHAHVHPYGHYSPYSRQSRSSVSSQLISSPGDTPPPLEGGTPSVLTSPVTPTESEVHICKWTTTSGGAKTFCGAQFSDPCTLQEHLIAQHMSTINGAKGTGYYCCWEGCHRPDEPFSQKSKLQGHFLTHSNYKNFRCSVCGKFFARQATLERHERSHRGEKPYKCSECGKAFTDSSELKTHSRTHTGEKPFKCTFPGCNFQTGDSSNMSSHRLTHGERKHKCIYPGCTKSFTRPDQLKRHMKSTHKHDSSTMMSPVSEQFTLSFPIV